MTPEAQEAMRENFHRDLPAILVGRDPEPDWNRPGLESSAVQKLLDQGLRREAVLTAVCNASGFTEAELRGRSRAHDIARSRQVACFLMRGQSRYSVIKIGHFLGGRDHTTILHAIKTVREKLDQGDEFTTTIYLDAKREVGE